MHVCLKICLCLKAWFSTSFDITWYVEVAIYKKSSFASPRSLLFLARENVTQVTRHTPYEKQSHNLTFRSLNCLRFNRINRSMKMLKNFKIFYESQPATFYSMEIIPSHTHTLTHTHARAREHTYTRLKIFERKFTGISL